MLSAIPFPIQLVRFDVLETKVYPRPLSRFLSSTLLPPQDSIRTLCRCVLIAAWSILQVGISPRNSPSPDSYHDQMLLKGERWDDRRVFLVVG